MHDVNSLPKLFKIGQQACFDQARPGGMWAGFERIRDDSLGRVHTYVRQGWQPRGVRILDSKLEATGTTSRIAGMTKVDAAGGLEL